MKLWLPVLLIICCLLAASCNRKGYSPPSHPLFTQMSPQVTGINFENKVTPTPQSNVFNYRNFYNGGGVAIGDLNNDGWSDIFLVSNMGESKLYLNKGHWHFVDVTKEAGLDINEGWSTGVALADVNGDGLLDIYVCHAGNIPGKSRANQLFINLGVDKNGVPHFKDEAHKDGLDDNGFSTQAVFFDYDGDGDLDCYVLNNSYRSIGSFGVNRNLRDIRDPLGGDRLYRNDHGHFVDVSDSAGIYGSAIGFGLGVNVGDVNGDMWPDIYISNDFFERDYLYLNQHNGTFKEVGTQEMGHMSQSSMGADMADINNDGKLDIFSTDMLPEDDYRLKSNTTFDGYDAAHAPDNRTFGHQYLANMLQLNNGDSTFSEIGELAGVSATDWSWGALIFDFNNDGNKDLFVTNGIYRDVTNQDFLDFLGNQENMRMVQQSRVFNFDDFEKKIPSVPISNYAFVNKGNLRFKNKAYALGLGMPSFSNGAAYGDLDNDGDLDLVVNNVNMPCFIYRNNETETTHNSFLRVRLLGEGMNRFGIGARVTCYSGDKQFVLQEMPQRGFESSVDPTLVFGLGKIQVLDSVKVIWPGPGWKIQVLNRVHVDTTLVLHQSEAGGKFVYHPPHYHPYFKNVTHLDLIGNTLHREDPFVDFDREPSIPEMLSTQGPKIAVGDVNQDGLQDFFIGGAKGDPGKIFIQDRLGRFTQMPEPALEQDKDFEDVGATFFDANGDGYPDLLVVSGGNEDLPGSPMLLPRLYLNDGKGHFSRSMSAIPVLVSTNGSCVAACDFDKDGDQDLFIGGRDVPGSYGLSPDSYLLVNDGKGHFSDQTDKLAPGLRHIGMVTDACWADVDGDGRPDLVVVGEWMPITIFKNVGGKFVKWIQVPHSSGWWNCIREADVNGDGRPDFIVGNLGLNSKIKADAKHPVKLYVGDYNHNGSSVAIMAYYKSDGKCYPLELRSDLLAQIPAFRNRFKTYASYAGKTINQVLTREERSQSIVLHADDLQTSVLINEGNGKFHLEALPLRAQFSPVYAIEAGDFTGDGNLDLFLGGNFYGVKPELGRYDASYGVFLKGTGRGQFQYLTPESSGIFVRGQVRDARTINGLLSPYLLVARNNDSALLFQQLKQKTH